MPGKCYVIEVHVAGVGGMNDPGKVAQAVTWALEGATVSGFQVYLCTGRNCTCKTHDALAEDWYRALATRLAPRS